MLERAKMDGMVVCGSVDEALAKMTPDPDDDSDLKVIQMTSLLNQSRDKSADAIEVQIEKYHCEFLGLQKCMDSDPLFVPWIATLLYCE